MSLVLELSKACLNCPEVKILALKFCLCQGIDKSIKAAVFWLHLTSIKYDPFKSMVVVVAKDTSKLALDISLIDLKISTKIS